MPRVPRLTEPQVKSQPLPTPYFTPSPADVRGAAGVDAARILGESVSQSVKGIAQVLQEEQDRADEVRLTQAQADLSKLETDLLYDPKKGVQVAKGQTALGVADRFGAAWDDGVLQIAEGLASERQRQRFRAIALRQTAGVKEYLAKYEGREREALDAAVTNEAIARVMERGTKGWEDPAAVDRAVEDVRSILGAHAARTGLPQDQKTADAVSRLRANVVQTMLDVDPTAARQYLEAHRQEITAEHLDALRKPVQVASMRADAQGRADTIWAQTAGDLGAAYEATRTIADVELRDETTRRVAALAQQDQYARSQHDAALDREADRFFKRDWKVGSIPSAIWSRLPSDQQQQYRDAERRYREAKQRPEKVDLDAEALEILGRWALLSPDAKRVTDPVKFMVGRVPETEILKAVKERADLIQGKGIKGYNEEGIKARALDRARALGLIAGKGAAQKTGALLTYLRERLDPLRDEKTGTYPPDDVERVIDEALVKGTLKRYGLWGVDSFAGDQSLARFEVPDEKLGNFTPEGGTETSPPAPPRDRKPGLVPTLPSFEQARERLTEMFRSRHGRPPDEAEIRSLYDRYVAETAR